VFITSCSGERAGVNKGFYSIFYVSLKFYGKGEKTDAQITQPCHFRSFDLLSTYSERNLVPIERKRLLDTDPSRNEKTKLAE